MAKAKEKDVPKIYQFKITLKHTSPPIWRRIQVPGNLDLIDLHDIIQVFMGWDNDHLFGFVVGGVRYEDNEETGDPSIKGVYETLISAVFTRKGIKGIYTYDFGDNWEHEVLVEGIIDPRTRHQIPYLHRREMQLPTRGLRWSRGILSAYRHPEGAKA